MAKRVKPSPPPAGGLAEEAEVLARLETLYPRGLDPATVAWYVSEPWRRNMDARAQAEAGARFFQGLVEAIEADTDLDVMEKSSLVDRPAWKLKVLLHRGKRFKEPVVTDAFLGELGGEARLIDLWISALGPYYYAKGYRVVPTFKLEIQGPPAPLPKDDPVAQAAMQAAAKALRRAGYKRVPGDLAQRRVPGLRLPGSAPDEPASVFELLFEGAPLRPAREEPRAPAEQRGPEGRARDPDRPTRGPDDPLASARVSAGEVDVDMELFQQELEAELDEIKAQIDKVEEAREGGAYRASRRGKRERVDDD